MPEDEVEQEFTKDKKLRVPVFKRLRDDKLARECKLPSEVK